MKTSRSRFLIAVGLLVISTSQIIAHYIGLSDFILGSLTGVGIGLMLLSFLKPKNKMAT
jgi:hypothetical protein